MFVPDGTVLPLAIGVVPAASENISPPMSTETTAVVLAPVTVTVNGPVGVPVEPATVLGVMVRLGGGGWTSGGWARTSFTMAATVSCRGSAVLRM